MIVRYDWNFSYRRKKLDLSLDFATWREKKPKSLYDYGKFYSWYWYVLLPTK